MADKDELVDIRVDVGVLKTQVDVMARLCDKMDKVIDRLIDNQEKITNQIYDEMQKKEQEKDQDVKELHSRITTISRELSDKVELTERRIMDEIRQLKNTITEHNKREDAEIRKILEWKWMAAGGIVVLAWLISHIKSDTLTKLLN
jgi:gas vesicle protein